MITVNDSTIVQKPAAEVYAFLVNLDNIPKWQGEVVTSSVITQGPTRKGTRFSEQVRMGPLRTSAACEITDLVPDQRMAFSLTSPPIDCLGTITMEPVREGTRVTISAVARPKGMWKLMQPFMSGDVRRSVRRELAQIKSIVERGAP